MKRVVNTLCAGDHGPAIEGEEALPVLAASLASGLNIGLTAMAKASAFWERRLAWPADWYLHDDALLVGWPAGPAWGQSGQC